MRSYSTASCSSGVVEEKRGWFVVAFVSEDLSPPFLHPHSFLSLVPHASTRTTQTVPGAALDYETVTSRLATFRPAKDAYSSSTSSPSILLGSYVSYSIKGNPRETPTVQASC